MRKKDLEILLQRVPPHPQPRAELEQYATPATVAADFLHRAYARGDVAGLRVLDLGCGTGVLGIGAALLGAGEVIGMDVDEGAVRVARDAAADLGVEARFFVADVREFDVPGDTAIMNPPFGAQQRGADRPFLQRALRLADVTYSLHLTETAGFVERFAAEHGGRVTETWAYAFPLRHQFRWQTKRVAEVPVTAFRIERDVSP